MVDKKKALETALAQIEKAYGKGTVMRLGENAGMNVEAISTGSIALDIATGIGGMPKGRIVEIYGPESSGKTTLALTVIAQAQKLGGEAAFIDAEHALDPSYASNLGVDVDALLVSQPDNGEQALEIAEALVRSGALDVVVIDSVAALVPRSEIEGEMGDSHVGAHARLMSQALRKIAGAVAKSLLEVSDHLGERMRAKAASDAVDRVVVFLCISFKGCVNRFLKCLEAVSDRDNVCAKHLHSDNIGMLLGNVNLAHIYVTFKAEISRCCCKRNSVLACARFCDNLFLAHKFGKETFAHAVIKLVRACVVKVFTLQIDLAVSEKLGEALAVVNGSGSALKLLADPAQLVYKLS